jgi:hypothetical protein
MLGNWSGHHADEVRKLFPTCHAFGGWQGINVIPNEIDVLLCSGNEIALPHGWGNGTIHTIVIGEPQEAIVGYSENLYLKLSRERCRSEQHDVMPVPPILEGPLREWLASFQDSRGMAMITDGWMDTRPFGGGFMPHGGNFESIAILMAQQPRFPLAVHHFDEKKKKGVAWFPSPPPNPVDWIRALLFHWAQWDPERLPGLRDWETAAEWMTMRELELSTRLTELGERRDRLLEELASDEARLRQDLLAARSDGNAGPRRILTSQNDELVSAVAQVLRDLGFAAREMDKGLPPEASKREDLRLGLRSKAGWEGIVEVKGYAKSGGKMSDIAQLANHAAHYAVEKGRLPDKRLYIVNGEFDTTATPSMRKLPFSDEDLAPFASDGGLALMTAELFRLYRDRESMGTEAVQRLLVESSGRLPPEYQLPPRTG